MTIKMNGVSLNGPRIGICSPIVWMNNSIVNAAEKGCAVNYGIGRGQSSKGCAGSGGAHGGIGGYGLAVNGSNELCSNFAPKPYTLT